MEEHALYERCLDQLGCRVQHLPDTPDLPDSVFVEDTAVVFDDLAVIARPGARSRRPEVPSVVEALRPHRRLAFIEAPGTLDGGDVLVTPGTAYVGISGRTNAAGARQLAALLTPLGMQVETVDVTGCLHLKSAVTPAGDRLLVLNPSWVDRAIFSTFDVIEIDPSEPFAANVLRAGGRVMCAAEHPRTRARLDAAGISTLSVPAGELAKAEGGLTCGSLIFATR